VKEDIVAEHKGEEFKGRMKEAAGDLTEDKDLQREGKADQVSSKTKRRIDDAKEKVQDTFTRKD
jgi:uncharacterized protein YjbJ (UPF0337 family)